MARFKLAWIPWVVLSAIVVWIEWGAVRGILDRDGPQEHLGVLATNVFLILSYWFVLLAIYNSWRKPKQLMILIIVAVVVALVLAIVLGFFYPDSFVGALKPLAVLASIMFTAQFVLVTGVFVYQLWRRRDEVGTKLQEIEISLPFIGPVTVGEAREAAADVTATVRHHAPAAHDAIPEEEVHEEDPPHADPPGH